MVDWSGISTFTKRVYALPLNINAIHAEVIERLKARGLGQPFIPNEKWAKMISDILRTKNLRGINLQGATLNLWSHGLDLRKVDLSGANLRGAYLSGVTLYGANLSGADLRGAHVYAHAPGMSMDEDRSTNLQYTNLTGAKLDGTNLSNMKLTGADLSKASLVRAGLFETDLSGVNLTGADLTEANLNYADLNRADLSKANLSQAALEDATLRGANLMSAKLTRANLTNADLREANLTFADLRGAETDEANFDDAKGLKTTKQGPAPSPGRTRSNPSNPSLFWSDELDELEGDPWKLAASVGVGILSNKEFQAGYQINGKVVAALFDDPSDPDEYSFDIVVSPQFQKLGLGDKLLNLALNLYQENKEARGADYKIRLDVINPVMERMLERKGFVRVGREGGITLMERSNGRQGR